MENSARRHGYDSPYISDIRHNDTDPDGNDSSYVEHTNGHKRSRDVQRTNRHNRSRDVQHTSGHNSSRDVQHTSGHNRSRDVQHTSGHNRSRDVQHTSGHNRSRNVQHTSGHNRSRDVQHTNEHNTSRDVQHTNEHNTSRDVQHTNRHNRSRDVQHTHLNNCSRDFEHINTNNSWRDCSRSQGNSISGDLEHSDGAVGGRLANTETSPLLNNDADNNQDDINVDGQTGTPFTLNRRCVLCVASVIIATAIATSVTFLISKYTNKDHDNATPAHCLPWSKWSQCSATCGVGVQTRTNQCYGNSTQPWQVTFTDSKECVERICDAHCYPWSSWNQCSATCGVGVQTRTRQCNGNSTQPWQATFTDSKECVERMCDAYCLPWSSWNMCSVTCGEGVQKRTRECSGNSTKPWRFTFTDSAFCAEPICLAHCYPWSSWNQCSATCGVGVQTRTRQCNGNSTQPWQATFTDSKECVERMCDAYCLPWSSWNMCSVTCGEGVQKRTRECSGNSTKPWQIAFTDSAFCAEPICLGKWLPWGPWNECSRTCGPGLKSRERGCSESYCGTNNTDVGVCQDTKCIGEWLYWGYWGSCSSSCGCGVRTRERGCSESYCGTKNMDNHICEKNAICKGSSFKPWNISVMIVLLLFIKQLIFNFT